MFEIPSFLQMGATRAVVVSSVMVSDFAPEIYVSKLDSNVDTIPEDEVVTVAVSMEPPRGMREMTSGSVDGWCRAGAALYERAVDLGWNTLAPAPDASSTDAMAKDRRVLSIVIACYAFDD